MSENGNGKGRESIGTKQTIIAGGLGALTPIIMTIALADAGVLLRDIDNLSGQEFYAAIAGWAVRWGALFFAGATWAWLNAKGLDAKKAFQIGMVAPAIITTGLNANNVDFSKSGDLEPAQSASATSIAPAVYIQIDNHTAPPPPPKPAPGKCFIKTILGKPCK